ncbi:MAG: hypothetical protein AAF378_16020 [Cyanobacteria bacterium P01_A01_bin.84]
MNKKFILTLLSSPTLYASLVSLLAMINPAYAGTQSIKIQAEQTCIDNPHGYNLVCARVPKKQEIARIPVAQKTPAQALPDDVVEVKFTEEESDSAIDLFGCDCPSCLNALRGMRGQEPVVF